MKVQEKGSDRVAEVHLHASGAPHDIAEYGQYEDPVDKALCCYVPVEEDQMIKVDAKFSGITYAITADIVVDGIYRVTKEYRSKDRIACLQSRRKLGSDKFLFDSPLADGFVETDMQVTSAKEVILTQNDKPETLGTIEVRLYVARTTQGDEHDLKDVRTYYNRPQNTSAPHKETLTYKTLAPTHMMQFNEDCAVLDLATSNRHRKRMMAKRPGMAPWAVLRFHYRSQVSIEDHELKMDFNPKKKTKMDIHELLLPYVPPLLPGARPLKPDEAGASTLAPSLPSSAVDSVPSSRENTKNALGLTNELGFMQLGRPMATFTAINADHQATETDDSGMAKGEPQIARETSASDQIPKSPPFEPDDTVFETKSMTSAPRTNDVEAQRSHKSPGMPETAGTSAHAAVSSKTTERPSLDEKMTASSRPEEVCKPNASAPATVMTTSRPPTPARKSATPTAASTSTAMKVTIPTLPAQPTPSPKSTISGVNMLPKQSKSTLLNDGLTPAPAVSAKRAATLDTTATSDVKRPKLIVTAPTPTVLIDQKREQVQAARQRNAKFAENRARTREQLESYMKLEAEEMAHLEKEMEELDQHYEQEQREYMAETELLAEFKGKFV